MKPCLGAGCLITVLGVSPERCRALVLALQARLAAQGLAAHMLPRHAPYSGAPPSSPQLSFTSAPDALAEQQKALNNALGSGAVLSEGGCALLAAEMGPLASKALMAAAQAQLARSTLVLLCANGPRDSVATQALDTRLRSQLLAAKVSFSVLHGDGDAALAQAWQALCMAIGGALRSASPAEAPSPHRRWLGNCDACSDSACEHRLFSDLLQHRGGA